MPIGTNPKFPERQIFSLNSYKRFISLVYLHVLSLYSVIQKKPLNNKPPQQQNPIKANKEKNPRPLLDCSKGIQDTTAVCHHSNL